MIVKLFSTHNLDITSTIRYNMTISDKEGFLDGIPVSGSS